MPDRKLSILHVSTFDQAGGAEKIAMDLHRASRRLGHLSHLAVGTRRTAEPGVLEIPGRDSSNAWVQAWRKVGRDLRARHIRVLPRWSRWLEALGEPCTVLERKWGVENFHFAGSRTLLKLPPRPPDVVHGHNLHGDYFDLRQLPALSHRVPVVLTLHDMWLFTGHCAHAFQCVRWKAGCGACPDLTIPPAVLRDATAFNWRRKRSLYQRSRVHVATPSRWLMEQAAQSALAPAVAQARVIPNGVDLSVFCPADRLAARAALGIGPDVKVLLFSAHGIRQNIWKDFKTLNDAVCAVAEAMSREELHFFALGEASPEEWAGSARIRFVPHQSDPEKVARYYQAADVYIHAAKADTFPTTVLEALACATPVVATSVGGIPEQVEDGKTGFLVAMGDSRAMAKRIESLLRDDSMRAQMADAAGRTALQRFGLDRMVNAYLTWYAELLDAPSRI
jgi:glycosyltransferase involved in cell wall biosynthesis